MTIPPFLTEMFVDAGDGGHDNFKDVAALYRSLANRYLTGMALVQLHHTWRLALPDANAKPSK